LNNHDLDGSGDDVLGDSEDEGGDHDMVEDDFSEMYY
jgi:hypothetical protein